MTVPSDWVEYRRESDRERLGWVRADGEGWLAIDLLGRAVGEASDLDRAERMLEERGLGYLAERWGLRGGDGLWRAVRVVEVSTERVVVKDEDFSAIDAPYVEHVLPWPAPEGLQLWSR